MEVATICYMNWIRNYHGLNTYDHLVTESQDPQIVGVTAAPEYTICSMDCTHKTVNLKSSLTAELQSYDFKHSLMYFLRFIV